MIFSSTFVLRKSLACTFVGLVRAKTTLLKGLYATQAKCYLGQMLLRPVLLRPMLPNVISLHLMFDVRGCRDLCASRSRANVIDVQCFASQFPFWFFGQ